jgi:hypothetical protein
MGSSTAKIPHLNFLNSMWEDTKYFMKGSSIKSHFSWRDFGALVWDKKVEDLE